MNKANPNQAVDVAQVAKVSYAGILKQREQEELRRRESKASGWRSMTSLEWDRLPGAFESERDQVNCLDDWRCTLEKAYQFYSGKTDPRSQSILKGVARDLSEIPKKKENCYKPGVTSFFYDLEEIFTPMAHEIHGEKVRNRYCFVSVEDRAKNCGSAMYVRYALIRMIDMVRIKYGDPTDSTLMNWIIAHDSIPTARLHTAYRANHRARSLRVDELNDLFRKESTHAQLIKGLFDCFRENFEFKIKHPIRKSDHNFKMNQLQRVKRAIERAVECCGSTDPTDPDSEWARFPGGTKEEPDHKDEAEIIQKIA